MNKPIVFSGAVILTSLVVLGFLFWPTAFTPQTDTFTFERDVNNSNDEGRRIDPATLVSREGVRLVDIFSPTTKEFMHERFVRYGADPIELKKGGAGLVIKFVRNGGGEVKPFNLRGWQSFEETRRDIRRREVTTSQSELAKSIDAFTAPIAVKRAFGVALDTTEGVTPELAKRVRQIIDETRAVQFGSDEKNHVALNLYNLSQLPYQGGREQPVLNNAEQVKGSIEWLLKERPDQKNSSVYGGLKAILEEMADYTDQHPVLHVITDGLENTDKLSVYKDPSALEEKSWSKLDQVSGLVGLKLAGLEVHMHPLPTKSAHNAEMMDKGLSYLADRLTKAGAKVAKEPL